MSLGGLGGVVEHEALVIGPVCEDEQARPFGLTLSELPHIESASILEEATPT